nr:restriction endonuclease subunit S [Bifidobacterium catenulatum]
MVEQHAKALVPKIRFAGFTDPWEQRKLGELFEEHSEKDRDDLPALTIIQGGGTVHRDESNRNLQFDRSSLSNYKVVDTGDFIVHLRSFEGGLEKATCYGLVSPAYHIFRGKNVDSDFYYLYFRSKRFIDVDLKPHVYGIRDGRSIDIEGMKTIFIPWTNLAEQRQIGAFFDRLDSLITLHQRKYDKLCVLKKSMLDKMFPKGGSLYPEIRFAGFTDPWEQRKLGEVAYGFEYGLNAAASDFDGEKKYLRITDIDDQTREFRTDDLSSPDINNPIDDKYLLKEGDILFARTGASVGKTYLYKASDGKTYYAGFLIRAHVSDEADAGFIFQSALTERYKQFVLITSQRSGQPGINAQEYADLLLLLPSLPEQRRIGAFFDRLDSLITLHQRKLELLRNIKKSMLNKMFV